MRQIELPVNREIQTAEFKHTRNLLMGSRFQLAKQKDDSRP